MIAKTSNYKEKKIWYNLIKNWLFKILIHKIKTKMILQFKNKSKRLLIKCLFHLMKKLKIIKKENDNFTNLNIFISF